VLKLFTEINFWSWYSTVTGIVCLIFYYITMLVVCTENLSNLLQPELNQEYYRILSNAKAVITIILLPIVALLPDITYLLITRIFFQTPTDFVMGLQKQDPHYEYQGFKHIEAQYNPDSVKKQKTIQEIQQSENFPEPSSVELQNPK